MGGGYQQGLGWTGRVAISLDVGELVVVVGARRTLKLHVADVVACLYDDPSMQMDLEAKGGNRVSMRVHEWRKVTWAISHLFVVGVFNEEVSGVRLLGGIRGQQAGAVGVAPPDVRAKGGE